MGHSTSPAHRWGVCIPRECTGQDVTVTVLPPVLQLIRNQVSPTPWPVAKIGSGSEGVLPADIADVANLVRVPVPRPSTFYCNPPPPDPEAQHPHLRQSVKPSWGRYQSLQA